jgi:hypothetical protein
MFRKRPVVVEAITFAELVEYGRTHGANIVNWMPWSFEYKGHPISHENDECYLIPTLEGTMKFAPGDMLITGVKGEIYPCKLDIFAATYEPDVRHGGLLALLEAARVESARAFRSAMHAAGYGTTAAAARAADHAATAHDSVDLALVRLGEPSDGGMEALRAAPPEAAPQATCPTHPSEPLVNGWCNACEMPPEVLAVLRDKTITLPGETAALRLIAEHCRKNHRVQDIDPSKFLWDPDKVRSATTTSSTPSAAPPQEPPFNELFDSAVIRPTEANVNAMLDAPLVPTVKPCPKCKGGKTVVVDSWGKLELCWVCHGTGSAERG